MTTALCRKSPPAPPNSSGTCGQSRPAAPPAPHSDLSMIPASSHRAKSGAIFDAAKRRNRHLRATGAQHRPAIIVAEQAIGGALHVHDVFLMRADAAQ